MSTGLPVEVERQRAPDVGAPTGTPGDRPMSLCPLAAVKGGGSNLG
ncbi:hypothetical protein EDC22_104100 [Tepidamorphus gemmatus]|uniref:Uncharacterized protein n=1 Tax=Tepidamorphus gemmatus TaxID=747076 RepID=A0A4R3MEB4_9HYPH|nr:hypothetical protein EDC22_104100 [Tepidamorphus gemmatus]